VPLVRANHGWPIRGRIPRRQGPRDDLARRRLEFRDAFVEDLLQSLPGGGIQQAQVDLLPYMPLQALDRLQ
jgi:hypothetical protein